MEFADNSRTRSVDTGIRPHHQVSAAWSGSGSEASESQQQRGRLQLKSGDDYYAGASDSEPVRRTTSYSRRTESRRSQHYSSASNPSSSNSNSNSQTFTSGSGGGGTVHRNSRVPSTGDYFYPTSTISTLTKSQSGRAQYPPLRKLRVGDGEGEVRKYSSNMRF